MSDEQVTETVEPSSPSIEEVAAQVFGVDAPTEVVEPEAAKAAPAVAEPPKVDPVAEKVAQRIEIAKKVELRAAAARAEVANAKAEVEAKRAELEADLKTFESFKAAKLSPSKALELLGMTPKEFLESLATENEPAAVAARAMQGTTSEVAKLQAKIDAMEKAAAEREQAAKVAALDTNYNQATQAFLAHVDTSTEKYPHLIAEYTPTELAHAARAAADQHAAPYFEKFGTYPDDEVIAEYLEVQAKARAEALAERRARIGKAPVPSKGVSSGDLQASQPDPGLSPRTLSSRVASEKATAAPSGWSQEAADEESLRILNAALNRKTG